MRPEPPNSAVRGEASLDDLCRSLAAGRRRGNGAKFSGGEVQFYRAEFSGTTVSFRDAEFSGGVYFNQAQFSGGEVDFSGSQFSGGMVHFDGEFSGGTLDFAHAQFSGGEVSFAGAKFCGGTLDFSDVGDRSSLPDLSWTDTPPPGVKSPGPESKHGRRRRRRA